MNRKQWLGLKKLSARTVPVLTGFQKCREKTISMVTMATFLVLLLLVPEAGAVGLWDIRGHWAEKEVLLLLEEGIIAGYPDQSFRPEQGLSRAEFSCLINRSFGLDETVDPGLIHLEAEAEAEADKWYARDLAIAVRAGYLVGYEDGSLRPENLISRQEAAVILARLLQLDVQNAHLKNLRDLEDIPIWSRSSIAALLSAGYIHGYEDGTFRPARIMTRAEVAVLLAKKTRLAEKPAVEVIALPPAPLKNASPSSGYSSHHTSTSLDRQSLLAAIARAQLRMAQVTAGTQPGQFPLQAIAPLQIAINQATHINETATCQSEIDQAFSSLREALQIFNDQENGPGGDSNILRGVFEVSH